MLPDQTRASSPEQIAAKNKSREQQEKRIHNDYRDVLSSVEGRRTMYRLLAIGNFWKPDWTPDPYRSSYNAGSREFVQRLYLELDKADPKGLALAIREHQEEKNA